MSGLALPFLSTLLQRGVFSRRGCGLIGLTLALGISGSFSGIAQTNPDFRRIANELVKSDPGALARLASGRESAEADDRIAGLDAAWYNTANGEYFAFLKQVGDQNIAQASGVPSSGEALGRLYLLLYRVTLKQPYYEAAKQIHDATAAACKRAADATPAQSEQNGRCASGPFLAEFAAVFQSPGDFDWIANSLDHPGDPSKQHEVAAAEVERAVALVETLPYIPDSVNARKTLLSSLPQIASALVAHQDARNGLFTVSEGGAPDGTLLPPEATCRAIYALFRAARLGYLPETYVSNAKRAWDGLLRAGIVSDSTGNLRWNQAGTSHAKAFNTDSLGTGAFLLAANEAELAADAGLARGKTILLDAWFNSQERKNAAGQSESFHYKWSDRSDSGFALLGHLLRSVGMKTETLYEAPTVNSLGNAQYYLIVSPDIPIKNPNPHYVTDSDAEQVAAWVKQGGILVILENDPPNADIDHLNLLADRVGLHFENVLHHHILGEQVEDGRIPVAGGGPLFQHPHTFYMKDTTAISLKGPGTVLLRDRGDIVMAALKYGRGTVFAAVDPWLYNEYTDGRKNPKIYSQFDNFAGGQELVRWLSQLRSSNLKTGKR